MMKIALFADIHGNFVALEAVLADIQRQAVDQVIVLGDLVFKGPQPEKCVETIQALQVPVIRGNIDELVGEGRIQAGFALNPDHEQDLQKEMAWTRARLSNSQLEYLRSLPFIHEIELSGNTKLRCVHATPHSILEAVLPNAIESQLEAMFVSEEASKQPEIVAYAHIHLPYVRFFNGKIILNTGSVGLTFDGDVRASYAMLHCAEDGSISVEIRRVPYDVERTIAAYVNSGHPFIDSVTTAIRNGRKPK
jgi:predicted phosphodiesterase